MFAYVKYVLGNYVKWDCIILKCLLIFKFTQNRLFVCLFVVVYSCQYIACFTSLTNGFVWPLLARRWLYEVVIVIPGHVGCMKCVIVTCYVESATFGLLMGLCGCD